MGTPQGAGGERSSLVSHVNAGYGLVFRRRSRRAMARTATAQIATKTRAALRSKGQARTNLNIAVVAPSWLCKSSEAKATQAHGGVRPLTGDGAGDGCLYLGRTCTVVEGLVFLGIAEYMSYQEARSA